MSATRLREIRDEYDVLPTMRINHHDEVVVILDTAYTEYTGVDKDEDKAINKALADMRKHLRDSAEELAQREQEYAAGRGV